MKERVGELKKAGKKRMERRREEKKGAANKKKRKATRLSAAFSRIKVTAVNVTGNVKTIN